MMTEAAEAPTIEEERDRLLPRIERDQRELGAAVEELRSAGQVFGKRATFWLTAGVVLLIAMRLLAWRRHRRERLAIREITGR